MKKSILFGVSMIPMMVLADPANEWQKTFDDAITVAQKTKDSRSMIKNLEPMMNQKFNFDYMTAMAMGKSWRSMSISEQQKMVPAFKNLLTGIYAKVIFDNRQSTIKVDKIETRNPEQATIYTTVNAPNKTYKINYSTKIINGKEQAYDVSVEGASLVTVYRNQFSEIYRQKGAQGLIDELNAKTSVQVAKQ